MGGGDGRLLTVVIFEGVDTGVVYVEACTDVDDVGAGADVVVDVGGSLGLSKN